MKTLEEIYAQYQVVGDHGHGDKGTVHSYLPTYKKLLEPYREKPGTMMEIGLAFGLSLSMWREYLPLFKLVGVDIHINFDPTPHYKDGLTTLVETDATKPDLLCKLAGTTFDIVIDDGSHMSQDQVATFRLLKSRMKPGGVYVIEDILSLDNTRKEFEALHSKVDIIDLRHVKNRFDDVLIVYRF